MIRRFKFPAIDERGPVVVFGHVGMNSDDALVLTELEYLGYPIQPTPKPERIDDLDSPSLFGPTMFALTEPATP